MRSHMPEWLVPAGLILLGVVPAVAGSARVAQLVAGADITAENARFFAAPLPVLLHIPAAVVYSLLGAFQFAPGFRRRRPEGDGAIVFVERLVFGSAMLVAVIVGIDALRRRAFGSHGAWMVRAYAIGLGAGTQVLTHLPWFVLAEGRPGEGPRALMMGAGWVINLAVAEWILRRPTPVPTPSPHSPDEARRTAFTLHRIRTCSSSH